MDDIVTLLNEAGFKTVVGVEAVKKAILELAGADGTKERLCSGYRVFPNGDKCPGCSDCKGQ